MATGTVDLFTTLDGDAGDPARQAGLDVSLGGYAGQQLSKPSTHQSEAIGLAAAVVILLFAFGTASTVTGS
jgi:putative drug exporter of the RND superfamily